MARRGFATEAEQDLVVVGGGPGGYVAAIKAAQLGLKTTCLEFRGTLGGTCLNVGCIPSKALLHTSHKYEEARKHFSKIGIKVEGVSLDLETMMKTKEQRVKSLTDGVEMLFKKNKVEYVKGKGKLVGPNEVQVALVGGGSQSIKAKNILIATGSDVASIPGVKIDEKVIVSSTGALSLTAVPKKMIVIGGGVIGLEMGSVWARLGSEVTVVEYTGRIAAGADSDVAKEFQKILKKQGLEFKLNTKVLSATVKPGGGAEVVIEDAQGGNKQTLTSDIVLVSVGRRPYTDDLGLENVGIKVNKRGVIEVDKSFKTNVPSIRAIGDVIPGPMLAHKAEEEGIAAVEDIVSPGTGHVNYGAIPSVIYTWPEVAWVGQTEDELKEKGVKYSIGKFPFIANSRAKTVGDTDGYVKFLTETETDKVLGVHIIGPDAGELIGESVLAIEYGASSEDISRTSHAHPTLSEAVKEAAMAAHGKPINF
jgi:dihydrolipoamide dehydrogenase